MRRLLLIIFATALVACNFSEEYNYYIPSPEESSATPPVVLFGEEADCLITSKEFGLWLCPAIEGEWDSIAWWVDERYTSSERTIHIAPEPGIHTVRAEAFISRNGTKASGKAEVSVRVVEPEQLPLRLHMPQSSYSIRVSQACWALSAGTVRIPISTLLFLQNFSSSVMGKIGFPSATLSLGSWSKAAKIFSP